MLFLITIRCYLQHLSNGPIDLDVSAHEEQMEEMQFLLDKRTKEVERVIKRDLLIRLLLGIVMFERVKGFAVG